MSINTKDVIAFGEKRLDADNRGTEEPKAWVDSCNTLAIKTARSEIINVLKNYKEMPIERYDTLIGAVEKTTTVTAMLGIDDVKDALKLMTKLKKDAQTITILAGNDTCVILRLNDQKGVVLELILATIRISGA